MLSEEINLSFGVIFFDSTIPGYQRKDVPEIITLSLVEKVGDIVSMKSTLWVECPDD